MTRPAIQLHSVRDLDEPLPAILRRVAAAGFEGVEFADRLAEADEDAVAEALSDTGLAAVGLHVGLAELKAKTDRVVERCERLGCSRVVIPHLPPSDFRTNRRVDAVRREFEHLGRRLDNRGIDLLYHNYTHDLRRPVDVAGIDRLMDAEMLPTVVEGGLAGAITRRRPPTPEFAQTGFGRLASECDPAAVSFEIDVGKVIAAERDPDRVLDHLGGRAPLVHLCDVVPDADGIGFEHVAPGAGRVDFEAAADAARRAGAEWIVLEHEAPDDPATAISEGAEAVVPLADRESTRPEGASGRDPRASEATL